jgi:pimeloyl-ACP methyl ester carboxylesterase
MSVFHPVRPPDWTVAAPPPVLPRCCQDHVYVFFIHGLDPLDYANLSGMRQYVHDLGYCQTYYGQVYHGPTFLKEIRRIRHEDPEAHFVLIGFSAGANVVRSMANQLGEEGTQVDLLVYMGGNTLEDVPENRPANVCKVVHILGSGYIWRGHQLTGAENIKYPDKWHFDSPTHPETLRKLGDELSMISCKVPVIVPVYPAQPEEIPLPRPVDPVRSASTSSPEWDFLKARTALSAPNSRWEKPEETANPAALSGRTRPARVTSR